MNAHERGQTLVEFSIILLVLLMLTGGLVDSGRAFYQYNATSAAARYGARWGSVAGGACALPYGQTSATADWCNKLKINSGGFWGAAGNKPLQGINMPCPSYSATPSAYYNVSTTIGADSSAGQQPTSIVGAVAKKFDSDSSSRNFITGALTPGLALDQVQVCISLSGTDTAGAWTTIPPPGSSVGVTVYYPFNPASALLPVGQIKMSASSSYGVE